MIFSINVEAIFEEAEIKQFLLATFNLREYDVNSLLGDNTKAKIHYEVSVRRFPSQFITNVEFFLSDKTCLELQVYNDLHFAIRFIDFFNCNVLIKDQSQDPYRWIFTTSSKELYIVDELLKYNESTDDDGMLEYDDSLFIDHHTLKGITIEKALSVLPDEQYILLKEEERPVFYNQFPSWG